MGVFQWNINIDRYTNRFVPPSPARHLPTPLGRFLGYRNEEPKQLGNIAISIWAFIGALASLSLIQGVCRHIPAYEGHPGSLILGSFGAAAVLEFFAIESPLAQPRNAILGQLLSSIIGVAISKGLSQQASAANKPSEFQWLAGSAACACSIVVMGLTRTVHPPAGATALLAVTDASVMQYGWMLVPLVVLSSTLMVVVAVMINNIQRRYPVFWWTPDDEVGSFWRATHGRGHGDSSSDCEKAGQDAASEEAVSEVEEGYGTGKGAVVSITLSSQGVFTAAHMTAEEKMCLEGLRRRLCTRN